VQAIVAQLQAQLQVLQQENQALHMDRAGRVLEQQTKMNIEKMKGDFSKFEKHIEQITRIIVAELQAKSKSNDLQAQLDAKRELALLGFQQDQLDAAHERAHDVGMAGLDREAAKEQVALQQPPAGAESQV